MWLSQCQQKHHGWCQFHLQTMETFLLVVKRFKAVSTNIWRCRCATRLPVMVHPPVSPLLQSSATIRTLGDNGSGLTGLSNNIQKQKQTNSMV
jgi:hypothetical protein